MEMITRALELGVWLEQQSQRNDGFDLKEAELRGRTAGLSQTVWEAREGRFYSVEEFLNRAYEAWRIGSTDEDNFYAVLHDGTDNYFHTGGWWPVLAAINRQHQRLKPAPLPEDPAERLDVLCKQISTSGPGYDMAPALDCLAELQANAKATIPITFTISEFLRLCEQWPFEHDPATPSVVRFSDTYGNPTYIIVISGSLIPVVEAIDARKRSLAMSGYPKD